MNDRVFNFVFWSIFGLCGLMVVGTIAAVIWFAATLASTSTEDIATEAGKAVAAFNKAAKQ